MTYCVRGIYGYAQKQTRRYRTLLMSFYMTLLLPPIVREFVVLFKQWVLTVQVTLQ